MKLCGSGLPMMKHRMQQNTAWSFQTLLITGFAAGLLLLIGCSSVATTDARQPAILTASYESADLADVTKDALRLAHQAGSENILVVFDIDNTLLAMPQGLGSDQWYEWQKELSNNDHCNPDNVGNRFAVQGALYFASAMRPTQPDASAQVKAIQKLGIPVIALTSRGQDYRLQTFRELRRNGFDFTFSAIGPVGGYDQAFIPVDDGRLSRYEDGVFLTAGQHKGQMLYALLKKTGTLMPAAIIMADDKQTNLDAIKETFSALSVPVHNWRITSEDHNVAGFDAQHAAQLWTEIEAPLREIQSALGPDNYDLSSARLPEDCHQDVIP